MTWFNKFLYHYIYIIKLNIFYFILNIIYIYMQDKQIETFISIIIIGYFGIKIVYGVFFNYYPQKYYYRNIDVTTNEGNGQTNTQNITLNAYTPGMWNNEMTDFITLIVLTGIIYIYTNVSAKSFIDEYGNLKFSFLLGYIIGLGYPIITAYTGSLINKEMKTSIIIRAIYFFIAVAFIIFVIIINYTSANKLNSIHRLNYTVYLIVIILLFFGLLLAKKNSKNYNSVTYFYNDGDKCTFAKNGILQTSGDIITITLPFLSFIILLLFSYEPSEISIKNVYTFIYGILLGILISGISYFGIEYFLQKQPEKECKDINECIYKEMPIPESSIIQNKKDIVIDSNLPEVKVVKNNISIIKMIILLVIIIIVIYLIYYYFFR
jgi:hypothetical protein